MFYVSNSIVEIDDDVNNECVADYGNGDDDGDDDENDDYCMLFLFKFNSGLFFVYPCMDSIVTVDLRTKAIDINPQEVSKIKHKIKLPPSC